MCGRLLHGSLLHTRLLHQEAGLDEFRHHRGQLLVQGSAGIARQRIEDPIQDGPESVPGESRDEIPEVRPEFGDLIGGAQPSGRRALAALLSLEDDTRREDHDGIAEWVRRHGQSLGRVLRA